MDRLTKVEGRTASSQDMPIGGCLNSSGFVLLSRLPPDSHTLGSGGVGHGSLQVGRGAQAQMLDCLWIG